MNHNLHDQIKAQLNLAQKILILSHIRPDGDAVGSLLGLGTALQQAGKEVQMVLSDRIPVEFRNLEGVTGISRKVKSEYDFAIVVDCSDLQRTGGLLAERQPDLNIDHHVTNVSFAKLNYLVVEAASTSEILANAIPLWGLPINKRSACALLTGIISDTIGFRTSSVTSETLRTAADLIELGADLPELYNRALLQRPYVAVQYWQKGLSRLQHKDGLVWTILTLADRQEVHYIGNDDADLINVLSTIDEAKISIIFIEQKDQRVKVSWRAKPGYDVAQIAVEFGGGGHPAASGAEISGILADVETLVLSRTQYLL